MIGNKYYPTAAPGAKMRLPIGRNILRIPLEKVKVYVPIKNSMLQCFRYKGHNPILFIDMESPRNEYKFMKDQQLHIGIKGQFETEPLFKSDVKTNRIDIYIALSEIPTLIHELRKLVDES